MMHAGFTIEDCTDVLHAAGTDLVLAGGQAVGYWANEFAAELASSKPPVSENINFWGEREELIKLAKKLSSRVEFPNKEMATPLAGVIQKEIKGQLVRVDVLHTIPGLDQIDSDRAAVDRVFAGQPIRVLDPVSLIASKIFNLRTFEQEDRDDEPQLRITIQFAKIFMEAAFTSGNARSGLNYCKRVLDIASRRSNQGAFEKYSIRVLDAIPIDAIRKLRSKPDVPALDREKLDKFLEIGWAHLEANGSLRKWSSSEAGSK